MLTKIQGHTYYYQGATNIGVIRYKNGTALLVDAGIDATVGRALAQALEGDNLKPKYALITHAHPDHFGALKFLKEQYPGLVRYAEEHEGLFMKYPRLESEALYGAAPVRELEGRFLKGPSVETDAAIHEGEMEIGDKRFRIVSLPGHTFNQIGVITGDSVLFAGDSLFSEEIMKKYGFPFLLDVGGQLKTLDFLAGLEVEHVVLSHGSQVYAGIKELCAHNKARIEQYLELVLSWCDQPLTREDITEEILKESAMEVDVAGYYMTYATAGAFLSYLANRQELSKSVIGGKCYFYRE
ncbi:MBL fold metallo-hydrolase [Paradesulfitobacterium aromaticivorans]